MKTTDLVADATERTPSNGLTRINKDLRFKLRHHAFALRVSQLKLLNQIVSEWLEEQPDPVLQQRQK